MPTASGASLRIFFATPLDASRYQGMSFWARTGSAALMTLLVEVGTSEAVLTGDLHGIDVGLLRQWILYDIDFRYLAQESGSLPFDSSSVSDIYFWFTTELNPTAGGEFEFWIDDIVLY